MAQAPIDDGGPPLYRRAGATIVVPHDDSEDDAPSGSAAAAPTQPPQRMPTPQGPTTRRDLPWWAFVAVGFVAALLGATGLTLIGAAIAALLYLAPWAG